MRFSALHTTAGAHCTHRNRYHASDTTVPCMRTQNVRFFPKSGSCTSACTVSNHSARGAPPPLWRPRVLPQRPQITAQPLPCTLGAAPAAVVRAEARFHATTGSAALPTTNAQLQSVSMASAAAVMLRVPAGMPASTLQAATGVREIRVATGTSRERRVSGQAR